MNKAQLIITAITLQGLSYRQAAHQFGGPKSWAHKIHHRWLEEGDTLSPAKHHQSFNPVSPKCGASSNSC
jgi:transposase